MVTTNVTNRSSLRYSGPIHEWHLVNASSLEQFALCLMSWLHKHVGFSGISFPCMRFKAIGTIGNTMCHDGFKQLLVQHIPVV